MYCAIKGAIDIRMANFLSVLIEAFLPGYYIEYNAYNCQWHMMAKMMFYILQLIYNTIQ